MRSLRRLAFLFVILVVAANTLIGGTSSTSVSRPTWGRRASKQSG